MIIFSFIHINKNYYVRVDYENQHIIMIIYSNNNKRHCSFKHLSRNMPQYIYVCVFVCAYLVINENIHRSCN